MDLKSIITKDDLKEPYLSLTEILDINDIMKMASVVSGRRIIFRKNSDDNMGIYQELNAVLSKEKVQKILNVFKGSDMYFPKLQWSCKDKIRKMIINEFDGHNYHELSRKYGYSERHIYNILNDVSKSVGKVIDERQLTLF